MLRVISGDGQDQALKGQHQGLMGQDQALKGQHQGLMGQDQELKV